MNIDYCDHHQVKMLYQRFYPSTDLTMDNAEKFVHKVFMKDGNEPHKEVQISAAQLQGYFMQHKFDGNEAILNVGELKSQHM